MLTLKMLNSDATLNTFFDVGSLSFSSGEDVKVVFQIFDSAKNLRYIPDSGATFSIDLLNSDGSTLNKVPTYLFDPDDRSILTFDITAAESANLISQGLSLFITEAGAISIASLQQALQKNVGGC